MSSTDDATIDRVKNAALALGWSFPFFLIPLGKVDTWEVTKDIKTMDVTLSPKGTQIRLNADYVASMGDAELAGASFHALFQPMLSHHERCGSRSERKWGRAAARSINQALVEMGVTIPRDFILPERGKEQMTAEELYDVEADDPEDDQGGGDQDLGKGGAPKQDPDGGGDGGEGDGEGDGQGQSMEQVQREWDQAAVQATALAAGTGAANVLARLFTPPRPRISYRQILRSAAAQAAAAHGRDDVSWGRKSRRSPQNGYLPGWISTKATIACVIDTSGSVSEAEVEECVGHVLALAREVPGIKIFLALHASSCYWHGWVNASGSDVIASKITDRGGTDADEAYARVGGCGKRVDVMVHLTDGELFGGWPDKPLNVRRLVVALTRGDACAAPEGTLVVPAGL